MSMLKRFQSLSPFTCWMLVCIALATLLRLVLIACAWPFTESDEGNMGIVALHVAFQGDHPVFFYGAPYMGPLEGYAAAPLFRLFGVSLFALRLPLVFFFALFLFGTYHLVHLLYQSKPFALASVILLGLGSPDVLFLQLRASGEYPEIEMFAVLMCLLALWLALTSHQVVQQSGWWKSWKRWAIYGSLGLIVGLAIWVDLLVLPFVATTGLLLCVFCWRELLRLSGLSFLLGVIVGAFPLIFYNLTAPWGQNSWFVLPGIYNSGTAQMQALHLTWLNKLTGTLFVALPMATSGSLHCPVSSVPPSGTPTPATLPCLVFQGSWSVGYLLFWGIALCLVIYAIRRYIRCRHNVAESNEMFAQRQEVIRQAGRLVVLISVGLTLMFYADAPVPAITPDTSFRYLTCLLLALPVLLWPAWRGLGSPKLSLKWAIKAATLLLVALTFASGMIETLAQIPNTESEYQSKERLVQDLLHLGTTRVYSEYWTCNVLTFLSQERIICSALDEQLGPGYDRYEPYRAIVEAAPYPTYIFLASTPYVQAIQQRLSSTGVRYRRYIFEGYVVYQET